MSRTPILIVGGGPVGLMLATILDRFGIEHVVVERAATTTNHPKARGLSARSMEIFRVLGLEEPIRARALRSDDGAVAASLALGQLYCESGSGRVLGTTRPLPNTNAPSPKVCVSQDVVEDVLAEAVRKNQHTQFVRETEMVSFENASDGVSAVVKNLATGDEAKIEARYLIACDGANSGIRTALGVETEGPGSLHGMASYYYRADLSHLPHANQWTAFWIVPTDPDVPFGPILATEPEAQRWIFIHYLEHEDSPPLSEADLFRTIRAHWGIEDLDIKLINMVRWKMQALLPREYRIGSILLAGDAAHAIPPTGGVGLNTGLADAHGLAWKLALVLNGYASDKLLDTYVLERRPVAAAAIEWATANRVQFLKTTSAASRRHEDLEGWLQALIDINRAFDSEGISMGYTYEQGALVPDGVPHPAFDPARYWPSDHPGARFPHVWLNSARTKSTIDWFDTKFVLVCGPDADDWRTAAEGVAREGSVPLAVRQLPWMVGPVTFERNGAILVRPDGHVAWRPGASVAPAEEPIRGALATVLKGGGGTATPPASGSAMQEAEA